MFRSNLLAKTKVVTEIKATKKIIIPKMLSLIKEKNIASTNLSKIQTMHLNQNIQPKKTLVSQDQVSVLKKKKSLALLNISLEMTIFNLTLLPLSEKLICKIL